MKVKAITEFLFEGNHVAIDTPLDISQEDAKALILLGRVEPIDAYEVESGGLNTETAAEVVKGKKKKAEDAE